MTIPVFPCPASAHAIAVPRAFTAVHQQRIDVRLDRIE